MGLADAVEIATGRILAMRVLEQAFRDFDALIHEKAMDGGVRWAKHTRRQELNRLKAWFFGPEQGGYSLEVCCMLTHRDPGWAREKAIQIERGEQPFQLVRRNGRKLSDEDVIKIRASGATTADVAREYGLAAGYVSRIRSGKRRQAVARRAA